MSIVSIGVIVSVVVSSGVIVSGVVSIGVTASVDAIVSVGVWGKC